VGLCVDEKEIFNLHRLSLFHEPSTAALADFQPRFARQSESSEEDFPLSPESDY
jgi:hypothetical protein